MLELWRVSKKSSSRFLMTLLLDLRALGDFSSRVPPVLTLVAPSLGPDKV